MLIQNMVKEYTHMKLGQDMDIDNYHSQKIIPHYCTQPYILRPCPHTNLYKQVTR